MGNVIFANLVSLQAGAASSRAAAHHLDPWQLVLQASLVVKLVMLVLVLFSVVCWFIIGYKLLYLNRASSQTKRFLYTFWESKRLDTAWEASDRYVRSPVAQIFRAGYTELVKVRRQQAPQQVAENEYGSGGIENVERSLRRAASTEVTQLESMVPFLATTGSTAPFIGLFGTVWGIMNSFIEIGGQQNASLPVVAPGIAEALIATAIGLVAAIPAVIAYNYFQRRIRILAIDMDVFSNDFLNIVRRHFLSS